MDIKFFPEDGKKERVADSLVGITLDILKNRMSFPIYMPKNQYRQIVFKTLKLNFPNQRIAASLI